MNLPLESVTTAKGVSTFNERTDRFIDAVETRVRSVLKPGEKPNGEHWRKAADEVKAEWTKKVLGPSKWYKPGTWGIGEGMRAMEAPAFPRTVARRDQIPAAELAKIAAAAAEKQTALSDQQIVDIYNQQIMKEPARAE
jgi:hypothetical protein